MKIPQLPAVPMIDSHAHLDAPDLRSQLDQVYARALAQGVRGVIAMGNDLPSSLAAFEIASRASGISVFPAAGLHPHEAQHWDRDHEALEALWPNERIVCIGEIGLDYFYNFSSKEQQRKAFRWQLEWAAKLQKPVSIHLRDAFSDGFAILREADLSCGGVVHCFQGGVKELETIMDLGLYVSFSGMVTFKNAVELRDAVPLVPADRYLIETDAPYLAPVPLRGKTNEPALVAHTANVLANLRGVPYEQIAAESLANTLRLFHLVL